MNNNHHSGRRLSPQANLSYKPPPLLASLPSLALRLLRACCPSLAPRLSLSRTHPGGGAPSCLSSSAVRARSSPYVIGPPFSVCCWLAPSPWLTESLRSFSNRPRFLGGWDASCSGCSSSTSITVNSSSAWLPSFGWPVSGGCSLGPGSAARWRAEQARCRRAHAAQRLSRDHSPSRSRSRCRAPTLAALSSVG